MISRLSISIIGLVFLLSCDSSTGPGSGTGSIMPLAVGHTWTYRRTQNMNTPFSVVDTFSLSVHDSIIIVDSMWYQLKVSSTTVYDTLREASDGIHDYGQIISSGASLDRLVYKYPGQAGDGYLNEYIGVSTTGDSVFRTGAIEATGRSVTVPAGTFSCMTYRFAFARGDGSSISQDVLSSGDIIDSYTIVQSAPGIGPVQKEIWHFIPAEGAFIQTYELALLHADTR